MCVMRGRRREIQEIGCDEGGGGAAWTPCGEAGGYGALGFEDPHGGLECGWVGAVDEDAGVGGFELVLDLFAAAGHARGNKNGG